MRTIRLVLLAAPLALALGGCVRVQVAQDKPIEINLNVNVRQEVIIKLEKEVQELIQANPNIF